MSVGTTGRAGAQMVAEEFDDVLRRDRAEDAVGEVAMSDHQEQRQTVARQERGGSRGGPA